MSASRISTHILDTSKGLPAAGVAARLEVLTPDGWRESGAGVTDADGRIADLGPAELHVGEYRIQADIGAYYRRSGTAHFFTSACVGFRIADVKQHYHVPLLISPFALAIYRGS